MLEKWEVHMYKKKINLDPELTLLQKLTENGS